MERSKYLTCLREKKHLTQEEVAATVHVSRQTVSRWEAGMTVPSMDNLAALSVLYGVPFSHLAGSNIEVVEEEPAQKEAEIEAATQERGKSIWRWWKNSTSSKDRQIGKRDLIIRDIIIVILALMLGTVCIIQSLNRDSEPSESEKGAVQTHQSKQLAPGWEERIPDFTFSP